MIHIILIGVAFCVAFFLYPYATEAPAEGVLLSLYAALHRPIWSVIVCMTIYLCYRRSAGLQLLLE